MLKPQLHNLFSSPKTLLQCHKPFFSENVANPTFSNIKRARSLSGNKNKNNNTVRYAARSSTIKSAANYTETETETDVLATVIVQFTVGGFLSNLGWNPIDDISDLFGKSIQLELVAAELDPCKSPTCTYLLMVQCIVYYIHIV